ncbi:unnamed protein product [Somion occarium]|uniref:Uncharacterized protein n=1 Tax=Somion occarium TaxID=3059160 RepID=A0ABP1DA77_9APHY
MCHRQLRFFKANGCGHLTFTGETTIDCGSRDCYLSSHHPKNCGSPASDKHLCNCLRYYTQPERIITHQIPGSCPRCSR